MSGYSLTRAAEADLAEIARYTDRRWGYAQAETYLLAFKSTFEALATFPDTGRPYAGRQGYLRVESGSHVVFYRKESSGVLVVRVLHRRMEPRRHLPQAV